MRLAIDTTGRCPQHLRGPQHVCINTGAYVVAQRFDFTKTQEQSRVRASQEGQQSRRAAPPARAEPRPEASCRRDLLQVLARALQRKLRGHRLGLPKRARQARLGVVSRASARTYFQRAALAAQKGMWQHITTA